jgi:hypothetical protein
VGLRAVVGSLHGYGLGPLCFMVFLGTILTCYPLTPIAAGLAVALAVVFFGCFLVVLFGVLVRVQRER